MPATLLRLCFLATCLVSTPVLAGVGATSSGVIPTGGGAPSTDPSAGVQAQSSGFVQQNQLNTANGVAGTGTAQGTVPGANGASAGGAANAVGGAKEKVGDPAAAGQPAAPATPPPPPPPPPSYVSNIKHVSGATDPGASTTATGSVAVAPPPAAGANPERELLASTEAKSAESAAEKPAAPPRPPPKAVNPNATPAAVPTKPAPAATKTASDAAFAAGGSGSAPDGYTFYLGIGIAMALLVFALTMYLRTQNEPGTRAPN